MQVCTSLQTDNHASTPPLSFLQAGCPSCCPINSVKALKALSALTDGNLTKVVAMWLLPAFPSRYSALAQLVGHQE